MTEQPQQDAPEVAPETLRLVHADPVQAYVDALVAEAPPLSPEIRARLAGLLNS